MEIIGMDPEKSRDMDLDEKMHLERLIQKYRKQVLGESCFVSAPSEYHEIALVCELKMSLPDWNALSLQHRAMIMAQHYLSNMVDTINSHYRAQDENKKKANSGTGSDESDE